MKNQQLFIIKKMFGKTLKKNINYFSFGIGISLIISKLDNSLSYGKFKTTPQYSELINTKYIKNVDIFPISSVISYDQIY